jgi:hypothetical protein
MEEIIYNKFKSINKGIVPCIVATVLEVQDFTCTVVLPDGLEMPGVRLKAANDKSKEFMRVKPRPNSTVLICLIGDDETAGEYHVVAYNEVDTVEVKIKDTYWQLDKDKIKGSIKECSVTVTVDDIEAKAKDFLVNIGKTEVNVKAGSSIVKVDNNKISLDGKKIEILSNGVSLRDIIEKVLTVIVDLKVITPTGPAFPDPTTINAAGQANLKNYEFFAP